MLYLYLDITLLRRHILCRGEVVCCDLYVLTRVMSSVFEFLYHLMSIYHQIRSLA